MAVTRSGRKRMKRIGNEYCFNENDFISTLPDCVLLSILEKLPVTCSVRTSALSRRWEHLWKSMSYVNVCEENDGEKNAKLFLKSFIRSNRINQLKHFSVSLKYNGYKSASCSWMDFALSKKVEELSLNLSIREYNWLLKPYPVVPHPPHLFISSSLVRLSLMFANLDPLPFVNLHSLKELHLDRSRLPDDGVQLITANCPLLEHLILSNCNRDSNLKITVATHSNLFKLTVDDKDRLVVQPSETSITAPKVTALIILGNTNMRNYSLDDVSDVVEAKLDFLETSPYSLLPFVPRIRTNIQSILEKLVRARMLRLCTRCILAAIEMRDVKFRLCRLELDTYLSGPELMGIVALLHACRRLRELVVNIMLPQVLYLDPSVIHVENADAEMHRLKKLIFVEFRNLNGDYQTWEEGKFDKRKFFQGCGNVFQLLRVLKSPAFPQVEHFLFTTRLLQFKTTADSV